MGFNSGFKGLKFIFCHFAIPAPVIVIPALNVTLREEDVCGNGSIAPHISLSQYWVAMRSQLYVSGRESLVNFR